MQVHSMNKCKGKNLLAFLRNGNYAHPGEEEAIAMVMDKFQKFSEQKILDVGCGLGGTAQYVYQNGWGKVTAFDIDAASIEKAALAYPDIDFFVADVNDVGRLFQNEFDLLYLFNTFYNFPEQSKALISLNKAAKNNAQMVIFDYTDLCDDVDLWYRDISPTSFFIPIKLNEIESSLRQSGWSLVETIDITEKYKVWYEYLVAMLHSKRKKVIELFGEGLFDRALHVYTVMLQAIVDKKLGGGIFYARKE